VRIATWNVNSVKQRVPRFLPWLDQRKPDILCLQETKLDDDGRLTLQGYFDTTPSHVYYDLRYILSEGEWKPIKINVQVKEPDKK